MFFLIKKKKQNIYALSAARERAKNVHVPRERKTTRWLEISRAHDNLKVLFLAFLHTGAGREEAAAGGQPVEGVRDSGESQ